MTESQPAVVLKPGREKPVLRRHPWLFSGSIDGVRGDPGLGDSVRVLSADGEFLGWASYSPKSQIRARIWSWEEKEAIEPELFRSRIKASVAKRDRLPGEGNARRIIYGESDGLPGLIVDQYGEYLVAQVLSAGIERWREQIFAAIDHAVKPRAIYERSDVEVRKLEGLEEQTGLILGSSPPELVEIEEASRRYLVDLRRGHKTGFYLDQRMNRNSVQELAGGKEVLDCFSYSGGFSVAALQGGAREVTLIDSSADTLELAARNMALNDLAGREINYLESDVFAELRTMRDRANSYGMIILDPPKFAPTSSHAQRAARGYKDINLWAFKLLKPGGVLVTFSCSGGIDRAFFQKIVADAALDAGVSGQIIHQLWQAPDHPLGLNYPESGYLKGFVVRVE